MPKVAAHGTERLEGLPKTAFRERGFHVVKRALEAAPEEEELVMRRSAFSGRLHAAQQALAWAGV